MTETELTPRLQPLMDLLDQLSQWIDEVPPIEQPMRFGNKAYRLWSDKVIGASPELLAKLGTKVGNFERCVPELRVYWEESFGSYERIDYGTGHELNFVVFLLCLFKMGIF